ALARRRGAQPRLRDHRAGLAGALAACVAGLRGHGRLRAAPREVQGDGRGDARVARAAPAADRTPRAGLGGGGTGRGGEAYRGTTYMLSIAMIAVGVLAILRTAIANPPGIAVGYVLGLGLVAAGVLRIILLRRTGD